MQLSPCPYVLSTTLRSLPKAWSSVTFSEGAAHYAFSFGHSLCLQCLSLFQVFTEFYKNANGNVANASPMADVRFRQEMQPPFKWLNLIFFLVGMTAVLSHGKFDGIQADHSLNSNVAISLHKIGTFNAVTSLLMRLIWSIRFGTKG